MNKEYFRIHNWLSYHHGKANKCENENCKSVSPKRFEWALLKGKDYEKNRNNYIMLCPSCHRKYDITIEQRNKMSQSAKGKKISGVTKDRISASLKNKNNTPIIKKNLLGEFIEEYESVSIAAYKNNILQSSISNCLIGKSNTSGGFLWHYKQMN